MWENEHVLNPTSCLASCAFSIVPGYGEALRAGSGLLGIAHSSQQWRTWLMVFGGCSGISGIKQFDPEITGSISSCSPCTEIGCSIHISFHRNYLKHFKLLSSLFVHIQSNFHNVRISQNQKRGECWFCAEQHQPLLFHLRSPLSSWSSSERFTSSSPRRQWCSPCSSQPEQKVNPQCNVQGPWWQWQVEMWALALSIAVKLAQVCSHGKVHC